MVAGEFIHSLHVPTKAYPHSWADFMTWALMKPPGAIMQQTSLNGLISAEVGHIKQAANCARIPVRFSASRNNNPPA
jgi:hypothetical protein